MPQACLRAGQATRVANFVKSAASRLPAAMLAPSCSFEEAVLEAYQAFTELVRGSLGGKAKVLAFGSFVQGSHLKDSDLDVCIDLPNRSLEPLAQRQALQALKGRVAWPWRLKEERLQKHVRVPILVLRYSGRQEVELDVSVGFEHEHLRKDLTDRLIRQQLVKKPLLKDLVRVVKTWAKREQLHKAFEGYPSGSEWDLHCKT